MSTAYDDPVATLSRLRALAQLLDSAWQIPGTRFRVGFDALIGLIPGVGDAAGLIISAYIVREARRLGVPRRVVARMVANIGVDALIGVIPAIGDLFDSAFKANLRNVRLLEKSLEARAVPMRVGP